MEFKKYSSISRNQRLDNGYVSDFVEYLHLNNYMDVECIVQQKIHGTNFNIHIDNTGNIKVGKRSGFLPDNNTFMGGHNVHLVEANRDKYLRLFAELYECYGELNQISIYTELAGGKFGDKVGTAPNGLNYSAIQGNADYCANQFIYHYDIYIPKLGQFLNPLESMKLFQKFDLFYAKELARGSMEDMLKFELKTNHVSLALEGSQLREPEGIVIKSIEEDRMYTGRGRIVVKKINPSFEQAKKSNKVKTSKSSKGLSNDALEYFKIAKSMVSETRVESVLGNMGYSSQAFEGKLFGQTLSNTVADIHKEMEEFNHGLVLSNYDYKSINKNLSSQIAPILKSWL